MGGYRYRHAMNKWGKVSFIAGLVAATLLAGSAARAHILNMTEFHLAVDDTARGTLNVTIDLGQSLLPAGQYWAAVQAPSVSQQTQLIAEAVAQLEKGIIITARDAQLDLELAGFTLNAVSQAAIANPLTPQMAKIQFLVHAPQHVPLDRSEFSLAVAQDLEIPWPALVRADLPAARLPISRLLTETHRNTRPFSAESQRAGTSQMWSANLAGWFQQWVPFFSAISLMAKKLSA